MQKFLIIVFVTIESCKAWTTYWIWLIYANIYVGKQSQVPILIGKGGTKLKELNDPELKLKNTLIKSIF